MCIHSGVTSDNATENVSADTDDGLASFGRPDEDTSLEIANDSKPIEPATVCRPLDSVPLLSQGQPVAPLPNEQRAVDASHILPREVPRAVIRAIIDSARSNAVISGEISNPLPKRQKVENDTEKSCIRLVDQEGIAAESRPRRSAHPISQISVDGNAIPTARSDASTGNVGIIKNEAASEEGEACAGSSDETSFSTNGHSLVSSPTYKNAWILAPMVRVSVLPFRLECLKYGADLVYTEEIVDKKLLNTVRHINEDFKTIEYISLDDRRCVFATCSEEREKVVLQLGTANAVLALQAANKVLKDVSAVDINMGCPKSFSVKGGMGAALLKNSETATDILKTLRRNINCPVTCKIRLLDTIEETVDFARMCESTGISAIAVHARILKDALSIPLIANGDLFTSSDAILFQETYGIDSLMFARGAMWNPAVFLGKPKKPHQITTMPDRMDVLQSYIKRAVLCGSVYQNIKFTLQEITSRDSNKELKSLLTAANSTPKICSAFGLESFYNSIEHVPHANTLQYHKNITF